MAYTSVLIAIVAILYSIIRFSNRTDIPKIKGLPEIPGVPLFGNLWQLGNEHAKRSAAWVKQFGPVFQVRLGNKVSIMSKTEKKHG